MPSDRWYTVETEHFRVHFTKALEAEGRRGAVNAERAWAELSTELRAPRGKVDLVIADNVDYVNGYATPLPSNRVVIYAHPPIDAAEIRNYDDWSRLVIAHELTHIFHIDRADGIWRLGRKILGRHPALFPNLYQPAWVIEGLAVYYESRITGYGRLEGSEHYMISRAAAEAGHLPRIGELSRETSRYPGGVVVYAYGGQIFDYIARTRGPETIPKFLDVTSKVIVPVSLNRKAKRAFGISFENAWRDWRDSLVRSAGSPRSPLPEWRELTRDGRSVGFPRWLGDTAVLYAGANGRDVPSAFSVSLDGRVTRLGRRNGIDANVLLPDGSILFSQPDFTDPFHVRNDLYVERNGAQKRLTHDARLSHPDARHDGAIIAVQAVPATTRIVRVSSDGRSVTPLTTGTDEVQWGEPRWSPDGNAIAAVRVARGSGSQIVLLDTLGAITGVAASDSAIVAAPSWASNDRILFTSTRSGSSQLYAVNVSQSSVQSTNVPTLLSSASTGALNPELSPDGKLIAALSFRLDGYHVGVAPVPEGTPAGVLRRSRENCTNCRLQTEVAPPITLADVGATKKYSPWQSLIPRYWEPLLAQSTGSGLSLGAATSGTDIVGRHAYYAEALVSTERGESELYGAYQYAGLGQPYLNFTAQQEWEHFRISNNAGDNLGDLARRTRTFGASMTLLRPRVRTSAAMALGADVESRSYSADPDTLLPKLGSVYSKDRHYPSVYASATWANTKRPALSISREDGVTLSTTIRQRWESGNFSDGSSSIIGVAAGYKSIDLPGFAHHVIAVRGAAGLADRDAISTFSAGGLSGGSLDVLAGLSIGDSRRTFGVRGFPPSAEQGIRAFAGTVEYRVPLAMPTVKAPLVPVLFDKISFAAFSEAGRAYCPAGARGICENDRGGPWLASVGGEFDLDTALQYDIPARFRIGVAVPVEGRQAAGADRASFYFTIGSVF